MRIIETTKLHDNVIIKISLVVDGIEDFGKISLTKRWITLGEVISREESLGDVYLCQVEAGYEDMDEYRQRRQEFTLFFKEIAK